MAKGGEGADVIGAAREGGQQARWLAREQTIANRPNQYNPWGSNTWQRTPYSPSTGGGMSEPTVPVPANYRGSSPGQRVSIMPATETYGKPSAPTQQKFGGWFGERLEDLGNSITDPYEGGKWKDPMAPINATKDRLTTLMGGATDKTKEDIRQELLREDQEAFGKAPPMEEWTQVERLNPVLQEGLDAQLGTQRDRLSLAQDRMRDVESTMGSPMDWGQFGDVVDFDPAQQRQAAEDAAYGRATSRLDPQFAERQNELQIALRNRGLREGDQAYDSAMANFERARNDAYEQARLGATAEGRQETGLGLQTNERANALRSQRIAEALQQRGMPLQEINALMQGQEIEGGPPASDSKATIADMLSGLFT